MTSNKNSIDSLNDATFIYFVWFSKDQRSPFLYKFHQCKIIKCTCHHFIVASNFIVWNHSHIFNCTLVYHISNIFYDIIWKKKKWVALYWITQSIQYWYYSCIISSYILYVIPFYGWLSFDRLADVLDKNEIIIVRRIYTSCFVKYHAYVVYET